MRNVLLFAIVVLYSFTSKAQKGLIAFQGFETSGSTWQPLSYSTPPCSSAGDVWDVVDALDAILPSEGESFWGIQDLNGDCGSNGFEWIELPAQDISGYRSVTFSMELQVIGYDAGDDIELEPSFDGEAQERVVLVDGGNNFSTDGWTAIEIQVPDRVSEIGMRIHVKQNGSDQAGIDNIRLEGVPVVPCSELLISEYIEGTSSTAHRNNFIEIYNATNSIISLSNFDLVKYTGSNLEPSGSLVLSGDLGPYATFLIEDITENLGVSSDLSTSSSVMDFNGDDKIALRKEGALVDVIGFIGDSLDFAQDLVLRRKSSIQSPKREFDTKEWDVYGLEQTGDLGEHQSQCSGPLPEITVFGKGLEIPDGQNKTSIVDNTYFGYQNVTSPSRVQKQFIILNQGRAPLEIREIALEGPDSADFDLSTSGGLDLDPGDSLLLNVGFTPIEAGIRQAYLSILSDDSSEPDYQILLQGEGSSYTDSPLMISTYYEGEGNNRWIEVTNISSETTEVGAFFLALFRQTLLNGPLGQRPSVKRSIPAIGPGESLTFRASLNVSQPAYALDGNEISTGVCGFNGDDAVVISRSGDETCWEKRVDIVGESGLWGQDIAYVRKFGCDLESPHSGFDPGQWLPFGPEEIDNAGLGNPMRLGEFYRGQTVFQDGAWSNGLPSLYRNVRIEVDYDSSLHGNLRACNLEVETGANLLVQSGNHLVIRNDLEVRGSLVIQNEGELLMIENSGQISGTGQIRIHRKSSELSSQDYTYWSSPVKSASLGNTFLGSNPKHVYSFDPKRFEDLDADGQDDDRNSWVRESGSMIPGKGYAVIAPEPLASNRRQQVVFDGTPNNGHLELPILLQGLEDSENDWNLIGNPYPSLLDLHALISDSQNIGLLSGAFYFWTHNTPLERDPVSGEYAYSSSDYAVYSIGMGGIRASSGGETPNGLVAVGQGFFAEALTSGTLKFDNGMRKVGLEHPFFKTSRTKELTRARKIWLNLAGDNGTFSQVLIGFKQGASPGLDRYYDAKLLPGHAQVEFYTPLESIKLSIRGEPSLNFPTEIPLGILSKFDKKDRLRIEIDKLTGSLNDCKIYIEDQKEEIRHDLKKGAYYFQNPGQGDFDNRFTLIFSNQVLQADNVETDAVDTVKDRIIWSLSGRQLTVKTLKNRDILDVKLFDMLGRTLISFRPNDKVAWFDSSGMAANAIYFLHLKTDKDELLSTQILML